MDSKLIQLEYNKIKNLKQYQNFTEEKLNQVAFIRSLEAQVDVDGLFTDLEDKKLAKSLLKKYLRDYVPETISDVNTLRSILFLEILNLRFQDELNTAKKDKHPTNQRTVETIHKNLNQILVLKDSLGLLKDKKEGNVKEADKKIAIMRKQFKLWCDNNQLSRQCTCPYCGQMFLLRIRMDHWEAQKHPFLKDRILYNRPLTELYLNGTITKETLSRILECSPDYIDWIISKIHKNKGVIDTNEKEEKTETKESSI